MNRRSFTLSLAGLMLLPALAEAQTPYAVFRFRRGQRAWAVELFANAQRNGYRAVLRRGDRVRGAFQLTPQSGDMDAVVRLLESGESVPVRIAARTVVISARTDGVRVRGTLSTDTGEEVESSADAIGPAGAVVIGCAAGTLLGTAFFAQLVVTLVIIDTIQDTIADITAPRAPATVAIDSEGGADGGGEESGGEEAGAGDEGTGGGEGGEGGGEGGGGSDG